VLAEDIYQAEEFASSQCPEGHIGGNVVTGRALPDGSKVKDQTKRSTEDQCQAGGWAVDWFSIAKTTIVKRDT